MGKTTVTLDQLAPGQSARVQRVGGAGAVRRRLMDMGITQGVDMAVIRRAPLGDPVEYLVRGYRLSLRRAEAQLVAVAHPAGS